MIGWFIWNGVDSRTKALWVTQIAPIIKPEERVKSVEIPGRAGSVTVTEGDNIYKAYVKSIIITVSEDADMVGLAEWLRGAGEVVFSNEPDRRYFARIIAQMSFDRISNSLKQATVQFYVQPYKGQYPSEGTFALTTPITNPGNIPALPLLQITGTGTIMVTIGGASMAFTDVPGNLTVDCDAEIITNDQGQVWQGTWVGDFIKIPPGENIASFTEGAAVSITPRWRWV